MSRWERFKKMNRAIWYTFASSIPYTLMFFVGQMISFPQSEKTPLAYWSQSVGWYIVLLFGIWLFLVLLYWRYADRFQEKSRG